jgi:hypothetical protein
LDCQPKLRGGGLLIGDLLRRRHDVAHAGRDFVADIYQECNLEAGAFLHTDGFKIRQLGGYKEHSDEGF